MILMKLLIFMNKVDPINPILRSVILRLRLRLWVTFSIISKTCWSYVTKIERWI